MSFGQMISPGVYRDAWGEVTVVQSELPGNRGVVAGVGNDYGEDDDDFSGIESQDDAFGDDDAAALNYLIGEIGRIRNPRKREKVEARMEKRVSRLNKKSKRKGINDGEGLDNVRDGRNRGQGDDMGWTGTALSGNAVFTGAGSANITIIPQHDFRSKNFKASGPAASTVNSINFGDRTVWTSSTGVPVEFLGATSTLQGLVDGATIRAGLSIIVNVTASGAGTVSVLFDGSKPTTTC